MFKRKKHDKEEVEEEKEELEEFEIQKIFDRKMKKQERRYNMKKYLLLFLVALGLVGFVRSAVNKPLNSSGKEVEAQTFVKTYAKHYYSFPKEGNKEYLDKFTLNHEWFISYNENIESASIEDVDIYKIIQEDEVKNITKYYCYGTLTTKFKGSEASKNQVNFVVSVAKQDNQYLVTSPIENVNAEIMNIEDEEMLDSYKLEVESTTESLSESEKKNIQTTLTLFVKTYNDDVVQARLLCSSPEVLDELEDNTRLEIKNIGSASQDDEKIYVSADIETLFGEIYKSNQKYYFEIEKEKNKITKMEAY